MKIIAHIKTDFPTKFGLPRQSGLIPEIGGKIVFEKKYRNAEALRGLDGFSHIWLLWQFSAAERQGGSDEWSPTVRPPMLGGNRRMGVFATRSPFRPNPIGMSVVKIEKIDLNSNEGPVIYVSGADLMDGTPIYDIKPYLPLADCITDALGGFSETTESRELTVDFPETLLNLIPADKHTEILKVLKSDPRPSYQNDGERVYGFYFCSFEILFKVNDGVLRVTEVKNRD